jgi:hypothetical protein
MSKGQRAIALAMIRPEPTAKGGRGKKEETPTKIIGVSPAYLQQARYVLRVSPDLARQVLHTVLVLNDAYDQARQLNNVNETNAEKMGRLQNEAPDLHATVLREDSGPPQVARLASPWMPMDVMDARQIDGHPWSQVASMGGRER